MWVLIHAGIIVNPSYEKVDLGVTNSQFSGKSKSKSKKILFIYSRYIVKQRTLAPIGR